MNSPSRTIILFIISGMILPAKVWAQSELVKQFTHCTKIKNDSRRLACFDAISITKKTPTSQAKPIATFGQIPAKTNQLQQVTLEVTAARKNLHQLWVLTFANGQVWQQKARNNTVQFHVGDKIVIQRGAMGAFHAKKLNSKRRILVKRLK